MTEATTGGIAIVAMLEAEHARLTAQPGYDSQRTIWLTDLIARARALTATQHSQNGEGVELLPCPFCGGDAERITIGEEDDNFGGDVIQCMGMCGASSHVEFGRKENLVSLWNTRQSLAREPATADVGREAADYLNHYAQFIRDDVKADDLERHPYLPAIEQVADALSRAAPSSVDHKPGCEHSRAPIKLCDCPAAPSSEGEWVMPTPAEERAKMIANFAGPVVSFDVVEPYYLASCDACGWVGSSEKCSSDEADDVFCPRCLASGADCGKVAGRIPARLREPAIAEGERAQALRTHGAWKKAVTRYNALLAEHGALDERVKRAGQLCEARYARLTVEAIEALTATTAPTTNDAIPAGMVVDPLAGHVRGIAQVIRMFPNDKAWGGADQANEAAAILDRAVIALSAAPSAPETEAGEEA